MTEQEKAIYDVIFKPCFCCYTVYTQWSTWNVLETMELHPPKPEEFAGYVTDDHLRCCNYCLRISEFVRHIPDPKKIKKTVA